MMQRASSRQWDFPSAVLLILILMTASQQLYATSWAPGLQLSVFAALLGVIVGLALGLSGIGRLGIFLLTTIATLIVLPGTSLWILFKDAPLLERLASLSGRLENSFLLLVSAQPVEDPILFVISMAVGFWIISLMAGYALGRFWNFAVAVIPAGIALILIQLFDTMAGKGAAVLAVYAFLCLLLLGRMTYVRRWSLWKQQNVGVSPEAARNLNVIFLLAAFAVVILAWMVPSSGKPVAAAKTWWDNLTRPFRHEETINNALAGLQNEQGQVVEFYGGTLVLGTSAEGGEDVYLHVYAPRLNGADYYYWRVRTYDLYLNGEWSTTDAFSEPAGTHQSPILLADSVGQVAEFTFSAPGMNLAQLVTPAHPVWVSQPSMLVYMPATDGGIDPLMLRADPPVAAGKSYTVHANIYNPTSAELTQAGTDYPAWVRDYYLQLPPDLSPRISELAGRLAIGAETPYDKVMAITDYLRTTIKYSETVTPPAGSDPLQWFLFDARQGFCNYYATAEVLLLRSLGIPARMVVGFSSGEFTQPNQYTVRKRDAHAWPEVYFPGLGWVEFEPTSSQPPIVRSQRKSTPEMPTAASTANTPGKALQTPSPLGEEGAGAGSGALSNSLVRMLVVLGVLVIAIIGLVVAYVFGVLDKLLAKIRQYLRTPFPLLLVSVYENLALTPPVWLRRWAHFAGRTPVERAFGVVYQGLRWLGEGSSSARTPAEAAAALTRRLPAAAGEIGTLLGEVQRTLYSRKSDGQKETRQAVTAIRTAALRTAVQQHWQAVKHIFSPHRKKG